MVSMLCQGNSVFYRPKEKGLHADNAKSSFAKAGGDQLALVNVYDQWASCNYSYQWCFENYIQHKSMKRARDIRDQLLRLCERVEIDVTDPSLSTDSPDQMVKCLLSGFFYNTARLSNNDTLYKTIKNPHSVMLHPQSFLAKTLPHWVMYDELVFTSKEFMRNVVAIQPEWLLEVAPHFYKESDLLDKKDNK